MKYLLILLFFTINLKAAVVVNLEFSQGEVFQGQVVNAKAKIVPSSVGILPGALLNGQTIADTIFIHEVSTPIKQEGENAFFADAQIVFIDVPKEKKISEKVNDEEVELNLGAVKVSPIDIPENFILGQFEIPNKKKMIVIVLIILGLIGVVYFAKVFYTKFKINKQKDHVKQKTKKMIEDASSYKEIVFVWQNKLEILKMFPGLSDDFKELEEVLFKIQFKPHQTESEIEGVLVAYRKFKSSVGGRLNGI